MKLWSFTATRPLAWAALALLPTTLVAMPALSPQQGGTLRRLGVQEEEAPAQQGSFEESSWRARLSDPDLDAREQSYEELVAAARRDPAARRALEQWTRDPDGELAWTARLALRELTTTPPDAFRFRNVPSPFGPGGLEVEWRDLRTRMDEIDRMFGSFGHDLDGLLREMGVDPGGLPFGPGAGLTRSTSESVSVEIGPGGVKARVTETVDGEEQTTEYEAESLEALLDAHPELRGRIGTPGSAGENPFGGLLRRELGDSGGLLRRLLEEEGDVPGLLDGTPVPPAPPVTGALRRDLLGIEFRPASTGFRERYGLDGDLGLQVERVVPGTIAEELGIREGDVLIEVNGVRITGGPDVSRGLKSRGEDEPVDVVVLDRRGERSELRWRPAEPIELPNRRRR